MSPEVEVDAVILASGFSKRMGTNKLLLPFGQSTIAESTLDAIVLAPFHTVFLVGSDNTMKKLAEKHGVVYCHNPGPTEGKSRAIRIGVKQSTAKDGILFSVADQPLMKTSSLQKLLRVFQLYPDKIVLPKIGTEFANPVIFPTAFRSALLQLKGDRGGKEIVRSNHGKLLPVEFMNREEFCDIDTPENYQNQIDKLQG